MTQRRTSHFIEKVGIDYEDGRSHKRAPAQRRISHVLEKVGIDYEDRRSHKRAPGRLVGCLSHGDDGRLSECVLLDLSASGAKVRFDQTPGDGEAVDPKVGQRLTIAAARELPVEVVWQDGPVAGLRFLDDPAEVAGALAQVLPPDYTLSRAA